MPLKILHLPIIDIFFILFLAGRYQRKISIDPKIFNIRKISAHLAYADNAKISTIYVVRRLLELQVSIAQGVDGIER